LIDQDPHFLESFVAHSVWLFVVLAWAEATSGGLWLETADCGRLLDDTLLARQDSADVLHIPRSHPADSVESDGCEGNPSHPSHRLFA
jgi:hypothetical protein